MAGRPDRTRRKFPLNQKRVPRDFRSQCDRSVSFRSSGFSKVGLEGVSVVDRAFEVTAPKTPCKSPLFKGDRFRDRVR